MHKMCGMCKRSMRKTTRADWFSRLKRAGPVDSIVLEEDGLTAGWAYGQKPETPSDGID